MDAYLFECEMAGQSKKTTDQKREFYGKFLWWNETVYGAENPSELDLSLEPGLKAFFLYLLRGHESKEGRWGNALHSNGGQRARAVKQLSPHARRLFRAYLQSLFDYLVSEGQLVSNPIDAIPPIKIPDEDKEPLSDREIELILEAARNSDNALRDTALIRFLLSTGCRASEVCELKFSDMDIPGGVCLVRGKGNKRRSVFFGKRAKNAVWAWKKELDRELVRAGDQRESDSMPFALAVWGRNAGGALSREGLAHLITRLCKTAGIKRSVGPHLFRHTFARLFLENGGTEKALQKLLGHRHLTVTHRYVNMNDAQIARQHAKSDPGEKFG